MKSASNGDIHRGSLQVLYVHVLLVTLLGVGHMAQPGTDQHEGGFAVWETDTTRVRRQISRFQPLNDIVSADASPVLTGKLAVTEFGMFWISIFILIRTPWIMRSTRCWRMAIKALRYSLRLTSLPHGWMRFFISNRPFSGWYLCGRMFLLID